MPTRSKAQVLRVPEDGELVNANGDTDLKPHTIPQLDGD